MKRHHDLTFFTNRCRYHDARSDVCKAGVRTSELVPESFGRALRLPCFIHARSKDVVHCDKLSRYTKEEAAQEFEAMDAAMVTYLSGKSPCCKAELTRAGSCAFCLKCKELVAHECRGGGIEEMP